MALILTPSITLVAGSNRKFLVTTTDTALSAWVAAALTIRADPLYPRYRDIQDAEDVDLSSWTQVLQVTNFTLVSATDGTYYLTATRAQMAALPVGRRRCVLDVWRTDSGNTYPDVRPTWVDVVSPVYPLP